MAYDEDFINSLKSQLEDSQNKSNQMASALSSSAYSANQAPNLIELQLDCEAMLEKIEHFLKGDSIITDPNTGVQMWIEQQDKDKRLFNDLGVNSLMSIYSMYVTPNTFLSFYEDITRINEILADLGDQINDYIYCNYEKIGLDTEFKKTRYGLVVISTIHFIENSYRRALSGDTVQRINAANININPGQQHNLNQPMIRQQSKKSWSIKSLFS